ncbi:uncharacterized protein [Aegilops tauschii subsp. strangulata]|uniref:uncharacterized protein isoform X2 n=1 Tax=Aegilops tauschii subsp. strangulata TaxID=200361 RepID=UPI001ABCD0C5|nr:uncharacterized protein LOC109780358 isoform X2 [Aegilops tauschii subsp. strangulata]
MRGTLLPPSSFDLDLGMSLPSYSDSAKVAYVLQAALMSAIYEENKDEDGFLYMTYSGENTFGLLYMALAATAIALNASCVVLATGFGALISKVAEHWYELYKMDKQGGNLWFIYWWEDKVSGCSLGTGTASSASSPRRSDGTTPTPSGCSGWRRRRWSTGSSFSTGEFGAEERRQGATSLWSGG